MVVEAVDADVLLDRGEAASGGVVECGIVVVRYDIWSSDVVGSRH